jgi:intracellular multiplication protein IcmC
MYFHHHSRLLWSLPQVPPALGFRLMAVLVLAFLPLLAQAQGQPDVGQMFASSSQTFVTLMAAMPVFSWLMGVAISFKGVLMFRDWAEGGGRTSIKAPIGLMIVGVLLIALPSTISMAQATLSLGANSGTALLAEGGSSSVPGADAAFKGVLLFVKLVGHIALIRGLLILKRFAAGEQGGELGRAFTHIGGGACAINIQTTIHLLANTIGATLPF